MRVALLFLLAGALSAQTPSLRPLHVGPAGIILDDSGRPVALRGLNRSGTGYGNADATATDQDYAAQNQLLSMNLVRIFVNTAWWTGNVQVPIANMGYQDYIDLLIQRAKKYGNYVLILKAGQFPDAPCGADGKNCPAPNQGDLNCQADSSVCSAQDTTGTYVFDALMFWGAFARKYGADPAVLYDTWEDMRGIAPDTWSNDENEIIATIRTYSPQSLIFVEDTGTVFESIVQGTLPDLAWPNVVWNFHVYNASSGTCTQPSSPRYASWPQNFAPLVSYAQGHGHAAAISEWGGCNDIEPYHTDITQYAQAHSLALAYFDSSSLITKSGANYQLTSTGAKVMQAYAAIAARGPVTVTLVANAEGESSTIAPNTWVEIKGSNLAPAGGTRIWQGPDFVNSQMPKVLDGVSATVNGKSAFVYYISPTQVNILTPPDAMQGPVQVQLTNGGVASAPVTVQAQPLSPSFFIFGAGPYVAAVHAGGGLIGPASLSVPGFAFSPAKPNETVQLYANGFGPTNVPVANGSIMQGGTLSPLPVIRIGGITATVTFAGLVASGEFQFNVTVPPSIADGDQPITATYSGGTTQSGVLLTVQR
jgi:uncharacterized protein (TIGR03437 family)